MRLFHSSMLAAVKALGFFTMTLLLSAAHAGEYAAIAWGADGESWGWSLRGSQKEANRVAISLCNERAPRKDCRLTVTRAVVKASGSNRVAMAVSSVSLKDARSRVVASCNAPNCKPVQEFTDPGFIAVAETVNQDSDRSFFVAYGYRNSDKADEEAKNGCERLANEPCKLWFSGAIPGNINKVSEVSAEPTKQKVAHAPSCRPTTPSVSCSSRCVNGDCVVTYENGCKIRVQVSPRFDSFSNQWKYPSPSC